MSVNRVILDSSMIQGYDTFALYCEYTILRIQHLYEEIAALQRSIEKGKKRLLFSS